MASIIFDLIALVLELVFWVVWAALPTVLYFTALALLFAATFGRVTIEFPETLSRIGWTGLLRITRKGEGRVILSPALGVIVGFVLWAVIVSTAIIVHAYRS